MEKLPANCARMPLNCNNLIAPSVTRLPGQPLTAAKAAEGYNLLDCAALPPGTMCPFAQALLAMRGMEASGTSTFKI